MAHLEGIHPNVSKFLDLIGWSEGCCHEKHPLTLNNGYDVIVTGVDGPEIFTDYSTHPFIHSRPPKLINRKGLASTASGKYQILLKYFVSYKNLLKLPDFSPESQDKIAIRMIKECDALQDIKNGNIDEAIKKCSSRWASFPGNDYGQNPHSMDKLIAEFKSMGGYVKES